MLYLALFFVNLTLLGVLCPTRAVLLHHKDSELQRETRVRKYTFNVARGVYAPDGVEKQALLVNNQYPGPTLEANYGDTFEITVNNHLDEGTAFHWHGLLQKGTMWYDGVPTTDNCPIAPGKSLTYTFKADQAGTSWWHSHYDAQLADGLFGAMIIYGSEYGARYDIELPPVLLGAHYHKTYKQIVNDTLSVPQILPFIDNNLINGRNTYNCSKITGGQKCDPRRRLSSFDFQTAKTHLIRLINVGAEGTEHFAIDGHEMLIIANDFIPVQPYKSAFVTLAPGQRTDIVVRGLRDPRAAYYMRANMSATCDPVLNPNAIATIYYPLADRNREPTSAPPQYDFNKCTNDALDRTVPLRTITPPKRPSTMQTLDIELATNGSGVVQFKVNGSAFYGDYNRPVLLLAQNGTKIFDPQRNVLNMGGNASVRLILRNKTPLAHPMHLHGHNPWILAEGVGEWDGRITNPGNPQRRDVQILQAAVSGKDAYLVLEWVQDNPGVWPLHCHISWHIAVGLFANFLERPDDLQQIRVPADIVQTCRDWWKFTGHTIVDQIDAGA